MNKTTQHIYHDETGLDAWQAASSEEHAMAVYIEGPTEHYVKWLEKRAAESRGAQPTHTPNISMLDEASQICQPIVSDIMDFFVRSTGCFEHLSLERKDEIRDNLYRIVAGKLHHAGNVVRNPTRS